MARPQCAAGNCLPGSDSGWFLLALGVGYGVVAVLFALLAARALAPWWRRRRARSALRSRRVANRAPATAVTVAELQRRLRRERPPRPPRRPRIVTVLPRPSTSPPPGQVPGAGPDTAPGAGPDTAPGAGPDTAPFDLIGQPDDGA